MRKSIKNLIVTFMLIISILQITTIVFAKIDIPASTSDFYVNDFANVFSQEEKSRLMSNAVKLSNESDGIQVVITTIKSLDGNSIEDYALDMYNNYGIGKNDLGLLILLSTEDREIRIQVGRAMEAYINDSKAGRIMDKYAISYLKENKFNEGLISLQEALISEVNTSISKDISTEKTSSDINIDFSSLILPLLCGLIVLILLLLIIRWCQYLIKKHNYRKQKISDLEAELETTKTILSDERHNFENALRMANEKFQKEKRSILLDASKEKSSIETSYAEEISHLQAQIKTITEQSNMLYNSYNQLEKEHSSLLDRYNRGCNLYPSLDKDISKMIEDEIIAFDKKKASEFDLTALSFISLSADKNLLDDLKCLLSSYNSLNDNQKTYVKTDIKKLEHLYSESDKLKKEYERKLKEEQIRKQEIIDKQNAQKAFDSINAIISEINVAKAKDLISLKKAKITYQKLTPGALKYFDKSILNRLDHLLHEAERDYELEQKIASDKKAAAIAVSSITAIIACMFRGRAEDLSELDSAISIYNSLTTAEKKYFDTNVLRKLQRLIEEAKHDKRDEENEIIRRRSSISSSSFNHHNHIGSSGGFRGHGGISSGGGASRKF